MANQTTLQSQQKTNNIVRKLQDMYLILHNSSGKSIIDDLEYTLTKLEKSKIF
jgi:hypothetical protein